MTALFTAFTPAFGAETEREREETTQPVLAERSEERHAELGDRAQEPGLSLPKPQRITPRLAIGQVGELRPLLLANARTTLSHDVGTSGVSGTASLSRLWVGLQLELFQERLSLKGRINLAPGHLQVVDYFVDIVAAKQARVRLGVMKVPFTRYRMQAASLMAPVGISMVDQWFGAEFQLGALVTDKWTGKFHYAAGVFTGKNVHASHAIGLPTLYGVELHDPSSLTDPKVAISVHPEIIGMMSYSTSDMGAPVSVDRSHGPWRVAGALSAAVDTRPDPLMDLAARVAPELVVRGHGLTLRALYDVGWFAQRTGRGPWRVGAHAALGELTYAAHRWLDGFVRYSVVAWTRALAASAGVSKGSQMELRAGFAVPIVGDQLKFTTDVAWTRKADPGTSKNGIGWESQFQAAF